MRPIIFAAMLSVLSISLATSAPTEVTHKQETGPETPRITLLVYDFARLREPELEDWRAEVTLIMKAAGIRVDWVDCGRGDGFTDRERWEHPRPGDMFLRIVDGRRVKGPGFALGFLGLAEPRWGGRGLVTVMVNNVRELAMGTWWQFPDLLAHATAHEIGHLLGIWEHSASGVMRGDWRKGFIKNMTHDALAFSADEARQLQSEAQRRSAIQIAQTGR